MSDPAEDIMQATFCALCSHGYAALTMEDIAEEADRSKAALHYHYDSKRGLMIAFLEYLFEEFVGRVGAVEGPVEHPDERLRAFVDDVMHPPNEDVTREFRTALLEIKAQAPYDETFQERLARFDAHISGTVRTLVTAGIGAGVYRDDVDPDEVARFVLTLVDGTQSRHVVAGADIDALQSTVESYLDTLQRPPDEVSS